MEIADFPHLLQTETDKCNFVFFRRQTIKRLSTIAVSAIRPFMVLRSLPWVDVGRTAMVKCQH